MCTCVSPILNYQEDSQIKVKHSSLSYKRYSTTAIVVCILISLHQNVLLSLLFVSFALFPSNKANRSILNTHDRSTQLQTNQRSTRRNFRQNYYTNGPISRTTPPRLPLAIVQLDIHVSIFVCVCVSLCLHPKLYYNFHLVSKLLHQGNL